MPQFGKYCHLVVVRSKHLTKQWENRIKTFSAPLHPFIITRSHRKAFVNNSRQKTWGRTQTHRLVAVPDAAVVVLAGIFFSVLFNCRETNQFFSVCDAKDVSIFKANLFTRQLFHTNIRDNTFKLEKVIPVVTCHEKSLLTSSNLWICLMKKSPYRRATLVSAMWIMSCGSVTDERLIKHSETRNSEQYQHPPLIFHMWIITYNKTGFIWIHLFNQTKSGDGRCTPYGLSVPVTYYLHYCMWQYRKVKYIPFIKQTSTHLVDVKVNLRSRLELSIQSRDATGPHQVLHLVFEDEQLNTELLLTHVQEPCQLGYWHGGVQFQEAVRIYCELDDIRVDTLQPYLGQQVFLKGTWVLKKYSIHFQHESKNTSITETLKVSCGVLHL